MSALDRPLCGRACVWLLTITATARVFVSLFVSIPVNGYLLSNSSTSSSLSFAEFPDSFTVFVSFFEQAANKHTKITPIIASDFFIPSYSLTFKLLTHICWHDYFLFHYIDNTLLCHTN